MRALLKPYPQRDLGIVLLRPPGDLLQHFSGKRLLITDEPADLRGAEDGLVPVEAQPLSRDPRLAIFLTSEPIINLVGGWDALTLWVKRNRGCQCTDFGGQYHHHELVQSRRGRGVVSLCWSHDNEYHGKESVKLDAAARANATEFVSEMIRARSRLPAGHQLTLPELCWWAISNGLASHLPEEIICEALGMRYRPPGEQLKESDISPGEREPREVLASNIKPVLALAIDPETPESYLRIPKRRRYENTKYTQWVKRQPCCGCGNGSDDPHHITGNGFGGMATKAHDLFVIPLCRRCHDSLHANTPDWEEEHGTQEHLLLTTLDRALAMGVIATGKAK
ncbi:DUF968 domain-containing protein [Rahnella victoriana]|uniref:DUF968 domain-containing protein n=1 Tax=Rahnella victoriana TaxID=1510570 RepID=A0ABS0DKX3_9GAMM|nr:DUF968 domain-containing protein [Rahnella victoriana]MBF7954547.1 DUF968 domain-containing protein [Rahnella victoriana]